MKKITMAECCTKTQENLKAFLKAELIERGYSPLDQDGFLFAEGELPVMLTAHMDTVHHDNCTIICTSPDGKYWMSPQGIGGDDRCGIYAIMKIIETHRCSVLFTEDEETGCIGAKKYTDFVKKNPDANCVPKNLNYIVEIDRKNADDAVFYSCDNPEFEKFVTEDTGFKTAHGSCSDISYVAPALGVAAVNFSSGYYNPHQISEYINLAELNENIRRIKAIIDKPCEKFEYIEKKYTYNYSSSYSSYGSYGYGRKNGKSSYYWDDDYDYDSPKQLSLWGNAPENLAYEDFLCDLGLYAEDYVERFEKLSSFVTYRINDEVENKEYEFSPTKTDTYYQDKDFIVYKYDEDVKCMVTCNCKIVGRKYSEKGNLVEPYFNKYSADYFYMIPPVLYTDFYNYYMENIELYSDDIDEGIPVDTDIEEKDQMEEEIMKLYN